MAKQRMINTKLWSDGWVRKLQPLDRYLFLYFLTNEHTNISGIYELPMETLAFETGIQGIELETAMFARLEPKVYYRQGWVIIPNFIKHQNQSSGKVVTGILTEFDKIPAEIKDMAITLGYEPPEGGINTVKIPRRVSVFIRDNGVCTYCEKTIEADADVEIDHIIPIVKNGQDNYQNLTLSCRGCNQEKGEKTALEYVGRDIKGRAYHSEKAIKELLDNPALLSKVQYIYPTLTQSILSHSNLNSNINSNSKIGTKVPRRAKPANRAIDEVIMYLKAKLGVHKLDGSEASNRRYAHLMLQKIGGNEHHAAEAIKKIMDAGLGDNFHRKNMTDLKYVYYNGMKIIAAHKLGEAQGPKWKVWL